MDSLYDRIGGQAAVRAVIQSLYDLLFDDVLVGFLFDGKDKARLVELQTSFTCAFLGGPERYEGKSLPEAHAALPLLPGHFDRRHHLLEQVLVRHGVPKAVRDEWLRIDEALRPSVLAAGAAARGWTLGTSNGSDPEEA